MVAARFGWMVDDVLAHKATVAEIAQVRALLTAWRDNDAKLQPQIQASFLLKEVAPLSQNLSALGTAGLAALDSIEQGTRPAPNWINQQRSIIAAGNQAHAELLLAVTPAVEKLIQAAR
jgi:hexosaminidase